MNFSLPLKPLSVNAAFQGRRFKTREAKSYERALSLLLPKRKVEGEYFRVRYDFHLVNFSRTDADNCVKVLQDAIVRQGLIPDDRLICELIIHKHRAEEDRIEVSIEGF